MASSATDWMAGLRRVCRRLVRSPLFTAVTVLTLGVGIGATTAIFSVVYGVLLKPLPYPDPDRLVGLWHTAPGLNTPLLNQSPATYLTYRELNTVFQDLGIWGNRQLTITGRGEPERVQGLTMTEGVFSVLGVQPHLGRLFTSADTADGAPLTTVLSHGLWQRKFGGSPDIIGKPLTIEGRVHEVIGVLPASFAFRSTSDSGLYIPLQFQRAKLFFGMFSYVGLARLKPGVTIDQANRDVARMIPLVLERFPLPPGFTRVMFDEARVGPNLRPFSVDVIGDVGQMLWVLLGTVGIVLLIACANVANLFLVRSEGRQQELALRAALGAGRGRIARELLAESVTLGLVSGVLGLALARGGLALLVWIAPAGLPRLDEIGLHPIVLLFALAVSILTGLFFGLIPVFRFGTPSIAALKEGGRSTSEGPQRHRARRVLVVAEIALALVLLIVSGLMVRTFIALRQVHPGFVRAEEVHTFRVAIPGALMPDVGQTVETFRQIRDRLAALPGVVSVGLSSSVTMDGNQSFDPVWIEGIDTAGGKMPPLRRFKWVGPGYVETMGNRLVAGRTLTWNDSMQRTVAVMVSENLARELFKDPAAAIGRRVRSALNSSWFEIVGVVGDERDDGANRPAPTTVFWPMAIRGAQFYGQDNYITRSMGFVVRTQRAGSPTLMRELQQAVWSVNPNLPLANSQTLESLRMRSMAQTSFALSMLAIAAVVALLLGIVGIYGVIAYIAAQRTREIGIRMALGAQAADVSRLFVRQGLWLTGAGVVLGVLAAVGLTRAMSSLLFGVAAIDPLTYLVVAVCLGGVAATATYLPARRAARIDPIVALRSDR